MSTKLGKQTLDVLFSWSAFKQAIEEKEISDAQQVVDIQDCLTILRIKLHNLDFELTKYIRGLGK